MEKLLVFGHKSPDTDSTCSAIVYAELLRITENENTEAYVLGELNKETEYALNFFGVKKPELLESVTVGQRVALVDHNEFDQSVKGITDAKIEKVIDHHRIGSIQTSEPLFYHAEAVGCTSTILFKMYKASGVEIDKKIAGMMLSAIISDTLLLKSPTCTKEDVMAYEALVDITGIDAKSYGLNMLKAGTDLDGFTAEELIRLDMKKTEKDGVKYAVAQVNTVSISDVLTKEAQLKVAIKNFIEEQKIQLFVFVITDIIESNSEVIALGQMADIIPNLIDDKALLKGVVSRKKQIIPMIEKEI